MCVCLRMSYTLQRCFYLYHRSVQWTYPQLSFRSSLHSLYAQVVLLLLWFVTFPKYDTVLILCSLLVQEVTYLLLSFCRFSYYFSVVSPTMSSSERKWHTRGKGCKMQYCMIMPATILNTQLYSGSSTLFGRRTEKETIKKVCFIAHSSMHYILLVPYHTWNRRRRSLVPPLYLHSSS